MKGKTFMKADKIKYARKAVLHASQEEFGNMLGVSRSSINNWELGTGKPERIVNRLSVE